MKSFYIAKSFGIVVFLLLFRTAYSQQLAFPSAEGYGKFTTGGRGGKLYIVSNLNDAGSGSLREALQASGKRTVIFKVSGVIKLQSGINISNGDLTILGQTAPGDGICIANYTVQLSASNIIIRYMRFRPGSIQTGEYDASWGRNNSNIILDHCSYSWGNDEQASFYDNTNFTMQYCIITESFYHSTHPKGDHGFGGIWGGMGATFHHNLIANHTSRTPRFCGARYHLTTASTEKVDFRNNVIFNWGYNNVYGGESGNHNLVNNYYKPGPATSTGKVRYRIVEPSDSKSAGNPISKWYVSGNYVDGNATVTSDNWNGGVQPGDASIAMSELKLNSALSGININTQSAADAYTKVLATAGASLKRDAVDTRTVNSVKSGTSNYGGAYGAKKGIIDNESQVGGFPTYSSSTAPVDSDNDGMSDSWETAHGLNKSTADQNADRDGDGYTNLEEYAGCLIGEFTTCDPTPVNVAPTVNITSPINNTSFTEPASITINATATDADGAISKVEFYNGATLLGTDATSAYSYIWSGVAAGTYTITAKATDNLGAVTTSSPITVIVNAIPKDCNGTANGTATLDNCSRCVGGTTGKTACTSVGEAETEACSFDGVIETKNAGYKGTSYLNIDNAIGTSVIFKISASSAGSAIISFRYANGGTTDRPAEVTLNDAIISNNISFPSTGVFTTWSSVDLQLNFQEGINTLKLSSATIDGLPNLDQLGFVSQGIAFANCQIVTGLEDIEIESSISIYPNPSSSNFYISLNKPEDIEITNEEGKILKSFSNVSYQEFGDDLKPGLYFAKIQNKVYKFVKY